jgi:hypothetical protein
LLNELKLSEKLKHLLINLKICSKFVKFSENFKGFQKICDLTKNNVMCYVFLLIFLKIRKFSFEKIQILEQIFSFLGKFSTF